MLKLYVKKLLAVLGITAVFGLIFYFGSGALLTTANFFANPVIRFAIIAGIPVFLCLLLIFYRRMMNMDIEGAYLAYCDGEKPTVRRELAYLFRFNHLRAELAVVETLMLLMVLALSASGQAPWYANFLVGVLMLLGGGVVFVLLDGLLWLLIHALWRRSAIKRAKRGKE
jgi:hypothetical protein